MKKNERKGVFETNSSSVHSLVWEMPKKIKLSKKLDIKDGVLTVHCNNFKQDTIVKGQAQKFEYIVTKIFRIHCWEYETSKVVSTNDDECPWELKDVLNAVNIYFPEIKEIKVMDIHNASMDYNYAEPEKIVNLYNDTEIAQFLFTNEIMVKIYMD